MLSYFFRRASVSYLPDKQHDLGRFSCGQPRLTMIAVLLIFKAKLAILAVFQVGINLRNMV